MSISKQFEKKMLKQMKRIFDYDNKIKVKVTKSFKEYKTTIQGTITVNYNILYLDSLLKPIIPYILTISTSTREMIFDFVVLKESLKED